MKACCVYCGDLTELNDSGECTNCQISTEAAFKEARELSPKQLEIIREYIKQSLEE